MVINQVGKYKILKEISRGGMGVVFLGLHPSLNRKVAIKMLPREFVSNQEFLKRFEREAKIIAELEHPNIVQVYDYEEQFGTYFIVMEYVEGRVLSDYIKEGKPMPQKQVAAIISQIANALAYAHKKGIVHRDIKPSNAIMRNDGVVKLMDFGIALSTSIDIHLTQEGKVVGTPKYMSPEQLQGKKIDHRSDIYSLGVMCYEMLAGKPPFDGKDFITIATKHLKEHPVPIRNIVPNVSPELEAFIQKSMEKDREKRLNSLENLALVKDADEKTVYFDALAKEGVSKKFFYITLTLMVLIAVTIVGGLILKQRVIVEKEFKEQIENITNKKVRDLVKKAKKYFDKKKYKEALKYLEKASLIDPKNKIVKNGLKEVRSIIRKQTKKKIAALEREAEKLYKNNNYFDAIVVWKEILLYDKDRKDIREKIKKAQAILDKEENKLKATEHLKKGDEYEKNEEYDKAIEEYLKAYKLNPNDEKAPYSLGLLYSYLYEMSKEKEKNKELIDKSIEYFEKALKIAPNNKGIIYNLSLAYLVKGNKEKALELAKKLKEIDKNEGENLIDTIESY